MRCLIDASVALAWSMPEEEHELADRLFAVSDAEFAISHLWLFEVANAIAIRRRRSLLDEEQALAVRLLLKQLPVAPLTLDIDELMREVVDLSDRHNLTAYDASYLYLALRERLPLATLDSRLRAAAEAAGCELFA